MGIESDKLVYDYLSRVGDVAQQRQLPSRDRMRLVAELRGEIDRRRGGGLTGDSPAAVRRILARLGTPDEVVTAAGGTAPAGGGRAQDPGPEEPHTEPEPEPQPERPAPGPTAPADRPATPPALPTLARALGFLVPSPRSEEPPAAEAPPAAAAEASGDAPEAEAPAAPAGDELPGLFVTGELGGGAPDPDWWNIDGDPLGGTGVVSGFTGGVEIPEMLRSPTPLPRPTDGNEGDGRGKSDGDGTEGAGDGEKAAPVDMTKGAAEASAAPAPRPTATRRVLALLRLRRHAPAPAAPAAPPAPAVAAQPVRPRRTWSNPLLLLAAALLAAGTVPGVPYALVLLAFGWVIAYFSRRLTVNESKWAVFGMPGAALAAGLLWLWGRQNRRWGEPIAAGHMSDAVAVTWPWVLRGAALASALFIVWRSQRHRG